MESFEIELTINGVEYLTEYEFGTEYTDGDERPYAWVTLKTVMMDNTIVTAADLPQGVFDRLDSAALSRADEELNIF